MIPYLKSYVYFAPTDEGVFFRSGSAMFTLKCPGSYPVVRQLLALFDGTRTEDAIVDELPENVRPLVRTLIATLGERNMLHDFTGDDETGIDDDTREQYGDVMNYLRDAVGSPTRSFARWRELPVTVVGDGDVMVAFVRGLTSTGVADVELVTADERTFARLEAIVAGLRERDLQTRVRLVDRVVVETMPAERVVVLASDNLEDATIARWTRHANLSVAGVVRGHCLVGPFGGEACASALLDRLAANEADAPAVSRSQLRLAGSSLAFELLKDVTGIASHRLRDTLFCIDGALRTSEHSLAPAAFDKLLGVFTNRGGGTLAQLPLYHESLEVRVPGSAGVPNERVIAWGFGMEDAGQRLLDRAFASYATRLKVGDRARKESLCSRVDRERFRQQAYAEAIAHSKDFATCGVVGPVELHAAGIREVQVLARVVKLYRAGGVTMTLARLPGRSAFVATCGDEGGVLGQSVAPTAREALIECLGDVVSAFQQELNHTPRMLPLPARQVDAGEVRAWLAEDARPTSDDAAIFVALDVPGAHEMGVTVGYAEIASALAVAI